MSKASSIGIWGYRDIWIYGCRDIGIQEYGDMDVWGYLDIGQQIVIIIC